MHPRALPALASLSLCILAACGGDDGEDGTSRADTGSAVDASADAGTDAAADLGSDATLLTCGDTGEEMFATLADSVDPLAGPIWVPAPGTTWHWQLTEDVDPSSITQQMVDIDLFDSCQNHIEAFQANEQVVICYFSAGSHEDWRVDEGAFPAASIGEPLDEWPGERWVDVRDEAIRDVMRRRLDLAVARGCNGVEPDNVNVADNNTGFPLTDGDQRDFLNFLVTESHARGLSVGLKNATDWAAEFAPIFDWSLVEECVEYEECEMYQPFIDAGKAVFHVEYVDDPADGPGEEARVCGEPTRSDFSTWIKEWDLGPWGIECA